MKQAFEVEQSPEGNFPHLIRRNSRSLTRGSLPGNDLHLPPPGHAPRAEISAFHMFHVRDLVIEPCEPDVLTRFGREVGELSRRTHLQGAIPSTRPVIATVDEADRQTALGGLRRAEHLSRRASFGRV